MSKDRIPLARPWLGDAEVDALREVVESGVLSRGGQLEAFEAGMAKLTNTAGGVGVNSGTVGLQIALEALGVRPGDEVIAPACTFVGTVNAIVRAGAKPVLVDVEATTLNIDPVYLRRAITPKTRAVLVVHLYGRPAPMDELLAVAEEHDLFVVEDACEAIGATYRGRTVGGLGDAGVFGFYPNKPLATGEGGMIVGNDEGFLTRCRQLRNQGRDTITGTRHDALPGLSARLSELHAALGNVQLARLDESLAKRKAVADRYRRNLRDHPGIRLPPPLAPQRETIAWFTFPIRLGNASRADRDRLIDSLSEEGIDCGVYFEPVHHLPFHNCQHDGRRLPISEAAGDRSIALPLYPELEIETVDWICRRLMKMLAPFSTSGSSVGL